MSRDGSLVTGAENVRPHAQLQLLEQPLVEVIVIRVFRPL
jgi:hypothetical protein